MGPWSCSVDVGAVAAGVVCRSTHLLAQNRQERRDRAAAELDRQVAERTQADTEFLAREIAGVRLALADVVTGEELREQLAGLASAIERLEAQLGNGNEGVHDDSVQSDD